MSIFELLLVLRMQGVAWKNGKSNLVFECHRCLCESIRRLVQVEEQMLISIRSEIEESWNDYREKERTEWVTCWPGQVVLAVSQIYWTAYVHNALSALRDFTLAEFHEKLQSDLQDIVKLVC